MSGYLLVRILLFIPTMLGILLISFFLSRQVPGDPVTQLMGESIENPQAGGNPFNYYREYDRAAASIDRNLPSFYLSIAPSYLPGGYFSEPHPRFKQWYRAMGQNLKPAAVVDSFVNEYFRVGSHCWERFNEDGKDAFIALEGLSDRKAMQDTLDRLLPQCSHCSSLLSITERLEPRSSTSIAPQINWWGGNNAFHNWISDLVMLDFGLSLRDGRPATARVKEALIWTLLMNGLALIGLLGLGIPIGIWLATSGGKKRTAVVSSVLYAGYAVPSFWLATLLLVFFSTTDWGRSVGGWMLRSPLLMSGETSLLDRLRVLLLPAFSIVLPSLAFVARQMEQSVRRELGQLYVTTARAKGLSRRRIIWRHVVPNALFPVITWLATLIPALLAGSVVIEVIFNIPGMGRLMWESIFGRDWPVVFTVLVLTSFLALFGQLSADVLYAFLDPRVQFGTKDDGNGRE